MYSGDQRGVSDKMSKRLLQISPAFILHRCTRRLDGKSFRFGKKSTSTCRQFKCSQSQTTCLRQRQSVIALNTHTQCSDLSSCAVETSGRFGHHYIDTSALRRVLGHTAAESTAVSSLLRSCSFSMLYMHFIRSTSSNIEVRLIADTYSIFMFILSK